MKLFYTDMIGVDRPGLAIIKAETKELAYVLIKTFIEVNPQFNEFTHTEITEIMEYSGLDTFEGSILVINGGVCRD